MAAALETRINQTYNKHRKIDDLSLPVNRRWRAVLHGSSTEARTAFAHYDKTIMLIVIFKLVLRSA